MEEYFLIEGGKKLKGKIETYGAKNAATALIAATLLTKKRCLLKNVPPIKDVLVMLEILKSMGGEIDWKDKFSVSIRNKNIDPEKMDQSLVGKLRSSVLLIGPLLARFKKIKIKGPGGCLIGARSIESHLKVFSQFGIKIETDKKFFYFERKKLRPKEIILPEQSVTATENALMLASAIPGTSLIKLAALEPYPQELALFLNKLGAKIKILSYSHTYLVSGKKEFKKGVSHFLIYDPIESGTFFALALASKRKLLIKGVHPEFLEAVFLKVKEFGAEINFLKENKSFRGELKVEIIPPKNLKPISLQTLPYPGFPTDLQAPFSVPCTQAEGISEIFEVMYEARLNHLRELEKMGAKVKILNPHQAQIFGKTPLFGREIRSFDLRSGATMILAALIAKGTSKIFEISQVDRGYFELEKRLQKIGAKIERKRLSFEKN